MDVQSFGEAYSIVDAGNQLAAALRISVICTCKYNVPYAGGAVERKKIETCRRCNVLEGWRIITGNTDGQATDSNT